MSASIWLISGTPGAGKVLLRPSLEIALQRNATRDTKPFDSSVLEPVARRLFAGLPTACPTEDGWVVLDSSAESAEDTATRLLEAGDPHRTGTR